MSLDVNQPLPLSDSRTFNVHLTPTMAWVLRARLRPAPFLPHREVVESFRHKIDDVILQFVDAAKKGIDEDHAEEEDLAGANIPVSVLEAWLIDQVIEFDGFGGEGTDLLLQVFRGFWSLRYGIPLSGSRDSTFADAVNSRLGLNDPKADNPPNEESSEFDLEDEGESESGHGEGSYGDDGDDSSPFIFST